MREEFNVDKLFTSNVELSAEMHEPECWMLAVPERLGSYPVVGASQVELQPVRGFRDHFEGPLQDSDREVFDGIGGQPQSVGLKRTRFNVKRFLIKIKIITRTYVGRKK